MKTKKIAQEHIDVTHGAEETPSVGYEVSKVALGVGVLMAALVGIWGLSCFIGGLLSTGGLGDVVKGYLAAVTGG
jgi:hypothetical protein